LVDDSEDKEKEVLNKILRGAILATFAVGATVAQADPFANPEVSPTAGTLNGTGYSNSSATVNVTTPTWNGAAGQFEGTFNPDGTSNTDDFFRFFCIELGQYFQFNRSYEYARYKGVRNISDAARPVDATNNKELSYLFDLFYPNKSTGNFQGPNNQYGKFASTTDSAAMQLAIWNIWYDTDFTLSSGTFHRVGTDDTVVIRANEMLRDVDTALKDAAFELSGEWTLFHFINDRHQNFLSATYALPDQPPGRIPLPGTLALFGIGLAGLGLARRKS
jgi:hypothetical protein